jgi:hypothetical protein
LHVVWLNIWFFERFINTEAVDQTSFSEKWLVKSNLISFDQIDLENSYKSAPEMQTGRMSGPFAGKIQAKSQAGAAPSMSLPL